MLGRLNRLDSIMFMVHGAVTGVRSQEPRKIKGRMRERQRQRRKRDREKRESHEREQTERGREKER